MATRKKPRIFCDHCQELVGYSTFYRHRDRFCGDQMLGRSGSSSESEESVFGGACNDVSQPSDNGKIS